MFARQRFQCGNGELRGAEEDKSQSWAIVFGEPVDAGR
jgi:hypothetical protein